MLLGVLGVVGSAWAQSPPQTPPSGQLQARYQVGVMERVLEQAVQHGAQLITRQMQAISPGMVMFTGPALARGFWLEDYGVFFDVEVPALRRSLSWSFRALNPTGVGLSNALQSLKRFVESVPDRGARDSLEQALARIELQVAPTPAGVGARSVSDTGPVEAGPTPGAVQEDPGEAYTREVKRALIDAMLDHSAPIEIRPEEWLTVAARDNGAQLASSDIYDVVTIVLRIKGADLEDFRSDRIDRETATKRVEVREF